VLDGALNRYYIGDEPGQIPGLLKDPYHWWQAGALWGEMVAYSHYAGDASYNDLVSQALLHQVGDRRDLEPKNQTFNEGNDDQAFWAFAAMTAAEVKFPDPPPDQPSWLGLAQAVFNRQAARWDEKFCGGGLRWQIQNYKDGYDYKNTISNGAFFQLAGRLALYTDNATYAEWASKTYDWIENSLLVTKDFKVFDGMDVKDNCTSVNHNQWSYNVGTLLMGAANMYNHVRSNAPPPPHSTATRRLRPLVYPRANPTARLEGTPNGRRGSKG
jgi:mannan endo-1,6-alpha-mannosidase